jgi:hypothetical protein
MITINEFEQWVLRHGYKKDKFGHWQKTTEIGAEYRWKLSRVMARHEIKVKHIDGSNEWVRISSGYLKNLEIRPDDKIKGTIR